jgi:hypothetical protein
MAITTGVATAAPQPASAAPATRAKPSCDPPYWIDAEGTKRYYRHCATH